MTVLNKIKEFFKKKDSKVECPCVVENKEPTIDEQLEALAAAKAFCIIKNATATNTDSSSKYLNAPNSNLLFLNYYGNGLNLHENDIVFEIYFRKYPGLKEAYNEKYDSLKELTIKKEKEKSLKSLQNYLDTKCK